LLNVLIGKSSAGVGSDAGFTKGIQKIKLSKGIILIDTPGVIPKEDYSHSEMQKIAGHTILGGRSYSQVKEPVFVVQEIMLKFPGILEKHYEIEANGDAEILIEELGKKQGFLKKGGIVNEDTTARSILKDWQTGKIRV
jgi:ribosome biogenesis GTPase A